MTEQKIPHLSPDGLPIIEPLAPAGRPAPDGAIAVCGACGLRLMPVMGYVCPRNNCPCFPRATC
jgi:hypothetical protein